MNPGEFEAHVASLSTAEVWDMYYDNLSRIGLIMLREQQHMRQKPLLGGVFGHGAFVLATYLEWGVLHQVTYYVLDRDSRFVLATGDSKSEALQHARNLLIKTEPGKLHAVFERFRLSAEAQKKEDAAEADARRAARIEAIRASAPSRVKSISRRRKQIFDESDGKCHYCATPLTLDGKWHVEHKMPRALGGGDEPGNLVASCAPCNHEKIDTTDVEYKAKRAAKTARGSMNLSSITPAKGELPLNRTIPSATAGPIGDERKALSEKSHTADRDLDEGVDYFSAQGALAAYRLAHA